jgi:Uma2 family endonuclease
MGGMTVTEPITRPWTIEDLFDVDDDGNKYELCHGVPLVTPPADTSHCGTALLLHKILDRTAPTELLVTSQGFGLYVSDDTYFIPDVMVFPSSLMKVRARGIGPADVRLAVEILSPSNKQNDLRLKRKEYAAAGIPQYWIIDPVRPTLTALTLREGDKHYSEVTVVRAGERFRSDEPFPVEFDLGEIF